MGSDFKPFSEVCCDAGPYLYHMRLLISRSIRRVQAHIPQPWLQSAKTVLTTLRGRRYPHLPIVIIIGQNKTGTTSMAGAFRAIGTNHNTINPIGRKWLHARQFGRLKRLLKRHDTVDDWPWNRVSVVQAIVDDLDELPPILFILTTREPEAWLQSRKNFLIQSGKEHRLPENLGLDEATYIQQELLDHNAAMRAIVPPERLLEGSVADEGFVEAVKAFTGYPIEAIPWLNKTTVKVH